MAGADFGALRDDVLAGDGGAVGGEGEAGVPGLGVGGVFDHENGVGAGRDGGAGHDLDRLAGGEGGTGPALAGSEETDDRAIERRAGVEREAVAGGAIEGRLVAVGEDRTGEGAAVGGEEREMVFGGCGEGAGLGGDEVEGGLKVEHVVHRWLL